MCELIGLPETIHCREAKLGTWQTLLNHDIALEHKNNHTIKTWQVILIIVFCYRDK